MVHANRRVIKSEIIFISWLVLKVEMNINGDG